MFMTTQRDARQILLSFEGASVGGRHSSRIVIGISFFLAICLLSHAQVAPNNPSTDWIPPSCTSLFSGRPISDTCDSALLTETTSIGNPCFGPNGHTDGFKDKPIANECRGRLLQWHSGCEYTDVYKLETPEREAIIQKAASPRLEFDLGLQFEVGECVPQDYSEAAYWYQKAAVGNYLEARNALARMYEKGLGVPKDATQSAYWDREAVAPGVQTGGNGEERLNSELHLGTDYYYGDGVPQDYAQAFSGFSSMTASGRTHQLSYI